MSEPNETCLACGHDHWDYEQSMCGGPPDEPYCYCTDMDRDLVAADEAVTDCREVINELRTEIERLLREDKELRTDKETLMTGASAMRSEIAKLKPVIEWQKLALAERDKRIEELERIESLKHGELKLAWRERDDLVAKLNRALDEVESEHAFFNAQHGLDHPPPNNGCPICAVLRENGRIK